MSKYTTLKLASMLTVAIIASLGFIQPAQANAGHYNVAGPSVANGSTPTTTTAGTEPSCYSEPTGFHSQIRFDDKCTQMMKQRNASQLNSTSTQKFVEPTGFHKQIRWSN